MTEKTQDTTSQNTETVQLDTPIQRSAGAVETIVVRKPNAGALRGISLAELLQLNVSALVTVLPRVTEPTLLKQEVEAMDPADLVALGTAVAGFLLPKAQRASYQST